MPKLIRYPDRQEASFLTIFRNSVFFLLFLPFSQVDCWQELSGRRSSLWLLENSWTVFVSIDLEQQQGDMAWLTSCGSSCTGLSSPHNFPMLKHSCHEMKTTCSKDNTQNSWWIEQQPLGLRNANNRPTTCVIMTCLWIMADSDQDVSEAEYRRGWQSKLQGRQFGHDDHLWIGQIVRLSSRAWLRASYAHAQLASKPPKLNLFASMANCRPQFQA